MSGASGEFLGRVIRKEVKVNASIEKVWRAWTTSEGAVTFFAPEAEVELIPFGRYELYFDLEAPRGSRGSEGCRVLSFLPMEMLSFEWNAPPEFAEVRREQNKKHAWVVIQLHPLEKDLTKGKLTHLGWKEGEEWDKVFHYFVRAWDIVLGRLERVFATGKPIDWQNPYRPPEDRTYSI